MKITFVRPFIQHGPVTGSQIADSTHSITHWGVVDGYFRRPELPGAGATPTHARRLDPVQAGNSLMPARRHSSGRQNTR
ncbi:hypothetical protein [Polaromonas sp.]|uniref:hypothetical protein n=1 Tax=Polaromonas sp. TaxID=1869339 RepID=UPI003CA625E9